MTAPVIDVLPRDDEGPESLAVIDVGPANPRRVDVAALMALAQRIARVNEFVPSTFRGRPEAVLATLLTGAELGLGPMQSLRSIHVIEGRPALSAEVMRALVLGAGHEIVVDESTDALCIVRGRRRDSDAWSNPVEWSFDRARRANLAGRQNWRNYPRQMLLARATGELCRTYFADVIGGLDVAEMVADERAERRGKKAAPATSAELPALAPRTPVEAAAEPVGASPPADGDGSPTDEGDGPAPSVGPPPAPRKRAPRKAVAPESPPPMAATDAVAWSDEPLPFPATPEAAGGAEGAAASATVDTAALSPSERDRRALHAAIGETFPDASAARRDLFRHALCILVSRARPDGPVTSSNDIDDGERMHLSQSLDKIRTGAMVVGVADDDAVEVTAGPWLYRVTVDPPGVVVYDTRANRPT